jgi:S-adenosylmethionine:tRNA ribosyltransferase-isomerase
VRTDDLSYELPGELIAQVPAARREAARLLVLGREDGAVAHRGVRDLPDLLRAGDLLVVNDTRVLPARLDARRASGGRVEVLFLEPAGEDGAWSALARAGGRLEVGEELAVGADGEALRILGREAEGRWLLRPVQGDARVLMERHGRMPLPPYVVRRPGDGHEALDRERYQTVYAAHDGAVAAPTAGLHLGTELLAALEARGVERCALTLHVGAGTFLPVRSVTLEAHAMHAERYEVSPGTAARVRAARAEGRRVVAVGTTCVRALEGAALASPDGLPQAGAARTDLFVRPGHEFRVVQGLLTNFHLPRSTLLALVGAFAGLERVLAAYREAVREGYRFHSYGDAMLIL